MAALAASPSHRSSRSAASSTSAGRNSFLNQRDGPDPPHGDSAPADTLETLVEHLLAAKRSLISITPVLRAQAIATTARKSYEEAVLLSAQSQYLQQSITDQASILRRIRKGLQRTYDFKKRDMKSMLKTMDGADEQLQNMMDVLRNTMVDPVFRPEGEDPKTLMDFLDEKSVYAIREALKKSIEELQVSRSWGSGYGERRRMPHAACRIPRATWCKLTANRRRKRHLTVTCCDSTPMYEP